MRYYRILADERMLNRAEPEKLSMSIRQRILTESSREYAEANPLQLTTQEMKYPNYADYLEHPLPLASDRLKQLLEKYVPKLVWRAVILTDPIHRHQEVYWLLFPPMVSCLSPKSEFHKDGTLKRLVMDEPKLGIPLFQIEGIRERQYVVNLALAESLLRRDFTGIRLERVLLDEGEEE